MKELISITEVGTDNSFSSDLQGILNAIVGVLGLVAVVVIIIGGVTYMTSSGDASKVKKAKDTILYGIIGLIVAALAFAVVNFVITGIIGGASA
jgi:TRAP-type C4-dicarboxylate transport system permease small subunit